MEKFTRFENARLISARALQLSLGAPPLVKASKEMPLIEVARTELAEKVLPMAVIREYPNGERKRVEVS